MSGQVGDRPSAEIAEPVPDWLPDLPALFARRAAEAATVITALPAPPPDISVAEVPAVSRGSGAHFAFDLGHALVSAAAIVALLVLLTGVPV